MNSSIKPGEVWRDVDGEIIEAHGASMFIEDDTFYWIGEDKSHTTKRGKLWTWGVRCYSSNDLYNWKNEGHIIPPCPEDKKSIFHPNRRLDRPHIIKNEKTGKYVCWLKYNDKANFSVLTADNLHGPYTIVKEFLQPYGYKSGDFDLACDPETGNAYLYFEVEHKMLLAAKLNETYTDVVGNKLVIYDNQKPPFTREAPAHMLRSYKHYLITSGMAGYVPNPSESAIAEDYMGKYTVQGNPHVSDSSSASFNSQISCIFKHPKKKDLYIAMADRWVPDFVMTSERYDAMRRVIMSTYDRSVKCTIKEMFSMTKTPIMGSADTSRSRYVWLPIRFEGDMPQINWHSEWKVEDFE